MSELKPCPFCGGEAKLICPRGRVTWIRCCIFETKVFQTKKQAIEAWNRRA